MIAKFVQIHYLTSYPAALLNRDDAGLAKRIPFGGVTRTRVSSPAGYIAETSGANTTAAPASLATSLSRSRG